MAKRKTKQGRARERGDTVTFTFEMEPDLNGTLEECSKQERRTKKAIITIALEEYFTRAGLWPPAGKE